MKVKQAQTLDLKSDKSMLKSNSTAQSQAWLPHHSQNTELAAPLNRLSPYSTTPSVTLPGFSYPRSQARVRNTKRDFNGFHNGCG